MELAAPERADVGAGTGGRRRAGTADVGARGGRGAGVGAGCELEPELCGPAVSSVAYAATLSQVYLA
jgi:hypothetical protein